MAVDNDIPLHIESDGTGEIEGRLGRETLEFVQRRLRETFPDQAQRPNCPNCTTSILWEALRAMLDDPAFAIFQKLQATTSMCEMVGPSAAALRVTYAMEMGETPDINDLLGLASMGFLTAEVISPDDLPEEVKKAMEENGIAKMPPRRFDA